MNHLNKEELEKLIPGDIIECTLQDENQGKYILCIISKKSGRNGYRFNSYLHYKNRLAVNTNPDTVENKVADSVIIDKIFFKFTINGAFTKDGIHNPGPNYLKRKYYKVCQ